MSNPIWSDERFPGGHPLSSEIVDTFETPAIPYRPTIWHPDNSDFTVSPGYASIPDGGSMQTTRPDLYVDSFKARVWFPPRSVLFSLEARGTGGGSPAPNFGINIHIESYLTEPQGTITGYWAHPGDWMEDVSGSNQVSYDAVDHRWLRIRSHVEIDRGWAAYMNMICETSPDGSTWTTLIQSGYLDVPAVDAGFRIYLRSHFDVSYVGDINVGGGIAIREKNNTWKDQVPLVRTPSNTWVSGSQVLTRQLNNTWKAIG